MIVNYEHNFINLPTYGEIDDIVKILEIASTSNNKVLFECIVKIYLDTCDVSVGIKKLAALSRICLDPNNEIQLRVDKVVDFYNKKFNV